MQTKALVRESHINVALHLDPPIWYSMLKHCPQLSRSRLLLSLSPKKLEVSAAQDIRPIWSYPLQQREGYQLFASILRSKRLLNLPQKTCYNFKNMQVSAIQKWKRYLISLECMLVGRPSYLLLYEQATEKLAFCSIYLACNSGRRPQHDDKTQTCWDWWRRRLST